MAKQKRKLIEKLLFEVYDKGVQMEECNLTDYYEKIKQALNIPVVRRSYWIFKKRLMCRICGSEWTETYRVYDIPKPYDKSLRNKFEVVQYHCVNL